MAGPKDTRDAGELRTALVGRQVRQSVGGAKAPTAAPARERVAVRGGIDSPAEPGRRPKGSHHGPRGRAVQELAGFRVRTR